MANNKRSVKGYSTKTRPNYTGRRIRALLAAGLLLLGTGYAIKKGIDIHEASSAQNTLNQYDLSLDNNVPGRAELGSIILDFSEQNPDMEDDFMNYLDAQKTLFNRDEIAASREKVNSYRESIKKLDEDVNSVISQYDKTNSDNLVLDNPMSIIEKYNSILKHLDDYDNKMPTELEALKLELSNELKSVKTKESILDDIKNRYIEEYNANENSQLYASHIKLAVRPQDYIIKTKSGKYITHGDYPNKVINYLGNGNIETLEGIDVYSIYHDDELLESIAKIGLKTHSIYDGNNPESINKNKSYKTLKEFSNVIDAGITWQKSPDDKYAKQKYIDALTKYYSNKENTKESNNKNNNKEIKNDDDIFVLE